jgi:hypothetical protein
MSSFQNPVSWELRQARFQTERLGWSGESALFVGAAEHGGFEGSLTFRSNPKLLEPQELTLDRVPPGD